MWCVCLCVVELWEIFFPLLFILSVLDVSTIKAHLHNIVKYRKSLVKHLQFLKMITSYFTT